MIKAMLIDDEPDNLQFISSMIGIFCPAVSVVGAYTDPFEGMEAILKQKPDVLLLDIEMPGMTGFELLRRLPAVDFELIFVTAHNQYALNAIKLSALDFLLKPVDPTELEEALAKVEQKLKEKKTVEQFNVLVNLLNQNQDSPKMRQHNRIALPTFNGLIYVNMLDVIMIEAEQNYCKFIIENRQSLTISKNIKNYEGLEEHDFMRVHRSSIINLNHVKEFVRHDGGYVVMTNGTRADVSKQKKDELLERLARL
jgi:two-component system LytT family response regulator